MELSYQKIKEITVGAAIIWEESDGMHFTRCIPRQLDVLRSTEPWCMENAYAPTGIRFDFHTDSSYVAFSVGTNGRYELKLDGILVKQYELANESGKHVVEITLGEGEHHVVFSLPNHSAEGIVSGIALEEGASCIRHIFDHKILFLGDSITQGWNTKFDTLSYPWMISDFLNAESVIQGIGATYFVPDTVADFGFDPDIVFVAYGTNDYHVFETLDALREQSGLYLDKVKYMYGQASIFVITPIWRQDIETPLKMGTLQECRNVIHEEGSKRGMYIINGELLVPPMQAFMADNVHPNTLGFLMYTLGLLKQIVAMVKF